MLIIEALQTQCDTHTVGGGTAEIAIELHQKASLSLRDNSRGRVKAAFSCGPSMVRTEMAPISLSRVITWLTRMSGAEAPAVTPTRLALSSHCGSTISGPSTR